MNATAARDPETEQVSGTQAEPTLGLDRVIDVDPVRRTLPVAGPEAVRRYALGLLGHHRRALAVVIGLHALAAVVGLVSPRLVGSLVEALGQGTTARTIDQLTLGIAAALVVQAVVTWFARRASFVLGEGVFADLREQFMRRVLMLPLSTVERAGTGDLVSRTTNDVEALSYLVRFGLPTVFVSIVTLVITGVAALVTAPLVCVALLAAIPLVVPTTRWYLRRAPEAYARERAAYAVMNGVVTETVDGARTVDALRLGPRRLERTDASLRHIWQRERRTLWLRQRWFPSVDLAVQLPVVATLLWGGWLVHHGHAGIAEVVAVTLYAQALAEPMNTLLMWLDELQVGAAALARVIGVAKVPADRVATGAQPADERLEAEGVRYAYRPGHDVLKGVSLDLRPGERLAVVGPSGAGKSTLGRLVAGIDGPTSGRVTVGGVPLVDLELDQLRREVALVTQEHHVFIGTLAENLRLARPGASDDELMGALAAVDADGWVRALPESLATEVGSGADAALTEAQSQQLALARLVLADPHTLVLDEATSLLDPRAARHLERSLAAVVEGRTVVAIAHRLHTAHDADRVAVVEAGQISELGSHDELLAARGPYAALWHSWRDE